MLDSIKQEERDLMILKISNKAKQAQDELRKYQMVLQRLNDLRQDNPTDKYGDQLPNLK